MPNLLAEALRLRSGGLSVIPVRADGTKRPAVPWKVYQHRRPTPDEMRWWFRRGDVGLGIIGGDVSAGLEVLDFDDGDLLAPWVEMVEALCPGLLAAMPLVQTPGGGWHVYYRCAVIAANQKLAHRLNAAGRPETCIETRGERGYVIAPPSPVACHPLRKPYALLRGDLCCIPAITSRQRTGLLNAARRFNAYVPPERLPHARSTPRPPTGERPGDVFAAQVSWAEILTPHGWRRIGQRGDMAIWRRPGKREPGGSATTNYGGSDLLYCFTTNGHPFEAERTYSRFAAYTLLARGGDFQAAARALGAQGYGAPSMAPQAAPPPVRDPVADLPTLPLRPYTGYRGLRYGRRGIHG
jgi:hypothetical protein